MAYPRTGASWRQRFYDTFTSYSTQDQFELAYPNLFSFDTFPNSWTSNHTSVHYATWGATNGPDGQPGVLARKTDNYHDIYHPDEWAYGEFGRLAALDGTEFRAVARIKNMGWTLFSVGTVNTEDDEDLNLIATVATGFSWASSPDLEGSRDDVGVRVYQNYPFTATPYFFAGQWPEGTVADIEIMGQVDATSGYVRVLFNGTELVLYEGPVPSALPNVNWYNVDPGGHDIGDIGGRVTNFGIYDVINIVDEDTDPSIPCCKTIRNAEQTPGTDLGVDPVGELPPWDATCEGGGQVEGVPDLTDGESWL